MTKTDHSSSRQTSTTTDPGAGRGGIFTGPPDAHRSAPATLPAGRILVSGAIGPAVLGATLLVIIGVIGRPGGIGAAIAGSLLGGMIPLGVVLLTRPGRPRPVLTWPFTLLAAQAGGCLGVIAGVVLLYFSTPKGALDPLVLVVASGASFIGSWVGMVRVVGARLREATASGDS